MREKEKTSSPSPHIYFETKTAADRLRNGETIYICCLNNSMAPLIQKYQPVLVEPVNSKSKLNVDDIVFCQICDCLYIHKILAIKNNAMFQIGNNRGFINGWIQKDQIYGRAIKSI